MTVAAAEAYERAQGTATQKVVYCVLTRISAGGAALHVLSSLHELRRLGYSAELVTGRREDTEPPLAGVEERSIVVPEMSRPISPWNDLLALWRLFCIFRAGRPDIVHTHTMKAGALGRIAAKLAGVPVIVHTFHGNVLSGYYPAPVSWAFRQIERCLALATDAICVLAPQQERELAERFRVASPQKLHLLPLGLDLGPFETLAPPRPRGWITAGWFGRFVPIKNIPLLIATIETTLAKTDRVRFLIAGAGPEQLPVERTAARFGPERVQFLGWHRELAPALAECDVVLQTSRNEGTPIALIEGMAARRPFISTAVGGVVDMVCGTGEERGSARWFENGVLVGLSPEAFSNALLAFVANPLMAAKMGERAAWFAHQNYTFERFRSNIHGLYTEMLEAKEAKRRPRFA